MIFNIIYLFIAYIYFIIVGEQLSQGSSRLYRRLLQYEMNGYVRR